MSLPVTDELTYLLIEGVKKYLCPGRNGLRARYATGFGVRTDQETGADIRIHFIEIDGACTLNISAIAGDIRAAIEKDRYLECRVHNGATGETVTKKL